MNCIVIKMYTQTKVIQFIGVKYVQCRKLQKITTKVSHMKLGYQFHVIFIKTLGKLYQQRLYGACLFKWKKIPFENIICIRVLHFFLKIFLSKNVIVVGWFFFQHFKINNLSLKAHGCSKQHFKIFFAKFTAVTCMWDLSRPCPSYQNNFIHFLLLYLKANIIYFTKRKLTT